MHNFDDTNKNILDALKQNIEKEIFKQDKLVDIKDLYVLFLDTNSFSICEELRKEGPGCTTYELNDFFTDYLNDYIVVYKNKEVSIPWRGNDKFCLLGGENAVSIPVKKFLEKNSLKDVTTKKNIVSLYKTIGDYLKEHPDFINYMFIEKTKQKQI